jgi:hypothetical protein
MKTPEQILAELIDPGVMYSVDYYTNYVDETITIGQAKEAIVLYHKQFNNPDAKTMPSRDEAEQRANELYSQAGQRRIHAFMDCYDWIAERMKP